MPRTAGAGESGNFIITDEGFSEVPGGSSDTGGLVSQIWFALRRADAASWQGGQA